MIKTIMFLLFVCISMPVNLINSDELLCAQFNHANLEAAQQSKIDSNGKNYSKIEKAEKEGLYYITVDSLNLQNQTAFTVNNFPENVENKYTLSICAIFKNEAPYLIEWIEYHRLFGVDHFYLYNIGSTDSYQVVLKPYIDNGIVTLVNWPEVLSYPGDDNACKWAICTQIPAYENALNFRAKAETKWLVFIDIDEFLVGPERTSIKDVLKKYDGYPALALSSVCFDATKYDPSSRKKLLIQTVELTTPPKAIVDKEVSKMIFKPKHCTGFSWAPYQCYFKDNQKCITVDRKELRINRYINRNIQRDKKNISCKKEKFRLDIDNLHLSEKETVELLEEGYLIEDQDRAIFQYIPELLQKMQKK